MCSAGKGWDVLFSAWWDFLSLVGWDVLFSAGWVGLPVLCGSSLHIGRASPFFPRHTSSLHQGRTSCSLQGGTSSSVVRGRRDTKVFTPHQPIRSWGRGPPTPPPTPRSGQTHPVRSSVKGALAPAPLGGGSGGGAEAGGTVGQTETDGARARPREPKTSTSRIWPQLLWPACAHMDAYTHGTQFFHTHTRNPGAPPPHTENPGVCEMRTRGHLHI